MKNSIKKNIKIDKINFFKTIAKVFKRADIVEQDQTKQNYYYGDYLLETNQITQEEYDKKQQEAKEIIKKAS